MAIEILPEPTTRPDRIVGMRCRNCGNDEPLGLSYVCPACFGPLEVEYDYAVAGATLTRASIAARPPGIWRYTELLPVDAPPARGLAVGSTPLVDADRLAPVLGLDRLWIKDDTRNPSLSFKDRAVAVAAARNLDDALPDCIAVLRPGDEILASLLAAEVAAAAGQELTGSASVAVSGPDGLWIPHAGATKHFVPSAGEVDEIAVVSGSPAAPALALMPAASVARVEVEQMATEVRRAGRLAPPADTDHPRAPASTDEVPEPSPGEAPALPVPGCNVDVYVTCPAGL